MMHLEISNKSLDIIKSFIRVRYQAIQNTNIRYLYETEELEAFEEFLTYRSNGNGNPLLYREDGKVKIEFEKEDLDYILPIILIELGKMRHVRGMHNINRKIESLKRFADKITGYVEP